MNNLYNFLNNFRTGVANADREVNNFLNQAGQELSNAWTVGTAPIVNAGQQIGNALGQLGQTFVTPVKTAGQQLNDLSLKLGQAMYNMVPQQNNQAQTTAQPAQTAQPTTSTQTVATTTPATTVNPNMVYYVRDPAIDNFVNTLRFITNPLRGITGWTPLDAIADLASDSMYSTFGKQYTPTTKEETKDANKTEDEGEYVTYTYKPGDTFGQVILDLGLNTGKGLWGSDGDVEFYNKQLLEQGIWPDNELHNIPIGTTIKLKRRKI